MTRSVTKLAAIAVALSGLTFAAPALAGQAADAGFSVATASDGKIRAGVNAYRQGDFKKSVSFSRAALKSPLSKKRQAVAQSNLCAAYAQLGDLDNAAEACDTALELRPNYAPAMANRQALTVQLAAK